MALYSIQNKFLTVTADSLGAELQSISGADGVEYLWQGDAAYWSGRAPNLFPYVARLTGGGYYMDGRLYCMDIHGFAPYMEFSAAGQTPVRLVMELSSSGETLEKYPRAFVLRIAYELCGNALSVTYEVENRDENVMYFGLGAHPGFRLPLREGRRFEDYRLRFQPGCCPRRIGFTPDCFLDGTDHPFPLADGGYLPLSHSLFDDDAIVLRGAGHQVTLEAAGDERSVTVDFPGMQYVGFWHQPRTDAPYICIEPWCSLPSRKDETAVFEKQADLIALRPGGLYQNTWRITFNGLPERCSE